ncbi:pirin family protein [Chitiniphilus purpureus]|uniref:Pirin family protein n=1 Tax=Chitiniphilus purpureus TaxID=2981137 RepID=A0ABY6DNX4_9NEIS|nr:pirin family protein [Chitiniphilus sp. CD1]UXY16042.1 pirin family protein [Chitiniphilus sp. CD1]
MKKLAFLKRSNGSHWVGDGFPVKSIFSYTDTADEMSPFLLMDYAGPADFPPTERKLGVGQHPHRGFETVTIVYEGGVAHRDSSGGGGTIGPGDVQWMTAASGLIHEEYHSPEFAGHGGAFEMIQLWVNLPARDKMAAPGYQGITAAQIPQVALPGESGSARIIAGRYGDVAGPARTFTPMNVWDLRLKGGERVSFELPAGHTTALFVLRGTLRIGGHHMVRSAELAVLERDGSHLEFEVVEDSTVLLLNGEPLNEPVFGYGPFVMNSREEIVQAIDDFNNGRFGQIGH